MDFSSFFYGKKQIFIEIASSFVYMYDVTDKILCKKAIQILNYKGNIVFTWYFKGIGTRVGAKNSLLKKNKDKINIYLTFCFCCCFFYSKSQAYLIFLIFFSCFICYFSFYLILSSKRERVRRLFEF